MKVYVLTTILILLVSKSVYSSDAIDFDDEMLKSIGIDSSVAKKLSVSASFMAGEQYVKIYVNNQYKKEINITINNEGRPCLTKENLKDIGIIYPSIKEVSKCLNLPSLWKRSDILLKPSKNEIHIIVPESAIDMRKNDVYDYKYGGFGGLINYSSQYMGDSNRSNDDMYFINSEIGFNANNWIFRSFQTLNHLEKTKINHQSLYAQTTIEKLSKNIQIGQVNLRNTVLSGSKIIGFQIYPESSLQNNRFGDKAIVRGIASESSMVEIYQSGQLIYNTAVSEGPFELSKLTLLNNLSDLHVYLKGVNGSQQDFIVPATTFLRYTLDGDTDYTFGFGRYNESNSQKKPMVISFSKGFGLLPNLGLKYGLINSSYYYNMGLELSFLFENNIFVSINNSFSYDHANDNTGGLIFGVLSYPLSDSLSIGFSSLIQSEKYEYLSDSVRYETSDGYFSNKQKQVGMDLNWSNSSIGSLGSSMGRSYISNDQYQDYFSLTWSKAFFDNYIFSATVQKNYTINNKSEDAFYFRLSIPLERANISTWLNHSSNNNSGVRYNNYASQDRNWSISYEHNDNSNYQAISSHFNTVTPYTQIGGNVRRDNNSQTNWGASLSGSAVWVDEGLILSPYEVKDTFGIAKVSDRRFIRIDSNSGPTWTNGNGYAVIPSLNAYNQNSIKVDTRSLSRQSDIANAYKSVTPAKGSVVSEIFTVINARRVLIKTSIHGKALPIDSIINDEAGNFLTLSTKTGEIFLNDAIPNMVLHVVISDNAKCSLTLKLPDDPEVDVLFETVDGQCISERMN
ncbi:fimbria/pilus outer membrane usher protein [Providencia rustigianii]|uniref:fimbria/pilus outer membrane usher protein n=1 Tax=Providencia rustigianii TaxID=158850 RepID=UPI0018A6EEAF|nr:fimbria/pilus outer membrane usher protein [Providencia rustigianii]